MITFTMIFIVRATFMTATVMSILATSLQSYTAIPCQRSIGVQADLGNVVQDNQLHYGDWPRHHGLGHHTTRLVGGNTDAGFRVFLVRTLRDFHCYTFLMFACPF